MVISLEEELLLLMRFYDLWSRCCLLCWIFFMFFECIFWFFLKVFFLFFDFSVVMDGVVIFLLYYNVCNVYLGSGRVKYWLCYFILDLRKLVLMWVLRKCIYVFVLFVFFNIYVFWFFEFFFFVVFYNVVVDFCDRLILRIMFMRV